MVPEHDALAAERCGKAAQIFHLAWTASVIGCLGAAMPAPERGGSPGLAWFQTGWGRLWTLPPLDAPACGNPGRISASGLAPLGPRLDHDS